MRWRDRFEFVGEAIQKAEAESAQAVAEEEALRRRYEAEVARTRAVEAAEIEKLPEQLTELGLDDLAWSAEAIRLRMDMMKALAGASGGQVRTGDPESIGELYKILSTYF